MYDNPVTEMNTLIALNLAILAKCEKIRKRKSSSCQLVKDCRLLVALFKKIAENSKFVGVGGKNFAEWFRKEKEIDNV